MDAKQNINKKDFDSICRLCLKKDRKLKPILSTNIEEDRQSLLDVISICTGININLEDGLPLNLCGKCLKKLMDFHSFRIQCRASEDLLRILIFKGDEANDYDCLNNDDWQDIKETHDMEFDLPINGPEIKFETKLTNHDIPKEVLAIDDKQVIKVELNNEIVEETNKPEIEQRHKKKIGRPKKIKVYTPKRIKLTAEEKEIRTKIRRETSGGICSICGKFIKNISTHLQFHEAKEKNESVECDYCHQKLNHKYQLKPHFDKHFKKREHQCSFCEFKFFLKTHLRRHLKTHSTERPFKCDICLKDFKYAITLKQHKKSHFKRHDIPCPYCDKLFLTRNNLKSHVGIHTGERPYKCEWCNASFVASSSLTVHRRKHKQDNPYINNCEICKIVFESKPIARNHMRVVHGININEKKRFIPIY